MSLNVVTVTIAATASPADTTTVEGNGVFVPSGTRWPAPGDLVIAPRIQQFTLSSGTASVSLVASDNFAAGVLNWNVILNFRGLPTISFSDAAVNYAAGATQNVFDILTAAGWTPIAS